MQVYHETPNQTYSRLLKEWAELYKTPTKKLINHLREQGYSDSKIARILNVSRQNVQIVYPKEAK